MYPVGVSMEVLKTPTKSPKYRQNLKKPLFRAESEA